GMFLAVFLPDGRRAVTLAHVNHLLVEVLLRFYLPAGSDLADVCVVHSAGAVENDERRVAAFQLPRHQLYRVDILHKESANDGYLLRGLPFPVGVDALGLKIYRLLSSLRHWMSLLKTSSQTLLVLTAKC